MKLVNELQGASFPQTGSLEEKNEEGLQVQLLSIPKCADSFKEMGHFHL